MSDVHERLVEPNEVTDEQEKLVKRAAALAAVIATGEKVEEGYIFGFDIASDFAGAGEALRDLPQMQPGGHSTPGFPEGGSRAYAPGEWDRLYQQARNSPWRHRERVEMAAARVAEIKAIANLISWDELLDLHHNPGIEGGAIKQAWSSLDRAIDKLILALGEVLLQSGDPVYLSDEAPSRVEGVYDGPKPVKA